MLNKITVKLSIVLLCSATLKADPAAYDIHFEQGFYRPSTLCTCGFLRPTPKLSQEQRKQITDLLDAYFFGVSEDSAQKDTPLALALLDAYFPPKPYPEVEVNPMPVPFPEDGMIPPPGMAYFVVAAKGAGVWSCLFSKSLKAIGGHLWVEAYYSNGDKDSVGHFGGGFTNSDLGIKGPKITRQAWLFPEMEVYKALKTAENFAKSAKGYNLCSHNCGDCVGVAADSIGLQLPIYKPPGGIASPELLYRQLLASPYSHKESKLFDAWGRLINPTPEFRQQVIELYLTDDFDISLFPKPQDSPSYLNAVDNPFPSQLNQPKYGGISLSCQAQLKISSGDINSAVLDPLTGQLILVGNRSVALPEMRVDDLAVAFKSIYGLGGMNPADPAVSIEPALDENKMQVVYYGQIFGTEFGNSLFEGDLKLKALTIGALNSNVPGYQSLTKRFEVNRFIPQIDDWKVENGRVVSNTPHAWRTWIKPDTIELIESDNRDSMIFNQVQMKCYAESYGPGAGDAYHQQFATHFTTNYESFSEEFPVFQEIKRLAQITGVVKWLKENSVPIDLTYFISYKCIPYTTPSFIDKKSISYGWMQKGKWYSSGISGGVSLNSKLAKRLHQDAEDNRDLVLSMKPNDSSMNWGLPNGNVAETCSVLKTKKAGNLHLDFVDFYYPGSNKYPLSFTRSYDSFGDRDFGMGLGWSVTPAYLDIPNAKVQVKEVNRTAPYFAFLKTKEGDQLFILEKYLLDGTLIYLTEMRNTLLLLNPNETWLFKIKNESQSFDAQGRLCKITDENGFSILYTYESNFLNSIKDEISNQQINLVYENGKLHHVEGPDQKMVSYDYNPLGELEKANDLLYQYDENHRLNYISTARKLFVFKGVYDDFNRLTEEKWGPIESNNEYSLQDNKIIRTINVDYSVFSAFENRNRHDE